LPSFEVGGDQGPLVIEHFFEMGDEPFFVRRIPGEASTQLIVNPTLSHPAQGGEGHVLAGLPPPGQKPPDVLRPRKFRGLPESSPARVEDLGKGGRPKDFSGLKVGHVGKAGFGERGELNLQHSRHAVSVFLHLLTPGSPGFGDPLQKFQESWTASLRPRGKVGAPVKRP